MKFIARAIIVASTLAMPMAATAKEPARDLPITASVTPLMVPEVVEPTAAEPMLLDPDDPPPATLPVERLPQYQIGYHRSGDVDRAVNDQGILHFVVPLSPQPDAPPVLLLVRCRIEIDGAPLSQTRYRRRDTLLTGLASGRNQVDEVASSEPVPAESGDESPAETSSEASADSAADDQDDIEDVDLPTEPAYTMAVTAEEVLARYVAATGETITPAESEWVLRHWADGPQLLLLNPYFQSFRRDQSPALAVLDRNHDGSLSPEEIEQAVASILRCDANRDEVVTFAEITTAARRRSAANDAIVSLQPAFLLVSDLVGKNDDDPASFALFRDADANGDGVIGASEIDALAKQEPDVGLHVNFNTRQMDQSVISVEHLSDRCTAQQTTDTGGQPIVIQFGGRSLMFTAVQAEPSDQVSIGVVDDGYPLLPGIDPNNDGRLTIRERRHLIEQIQAHDVDGDGSLSRDEVQSPVRICLGLGPTVHQALATVRTLPTVAAANAANRPEWFTQMDRNRDNDLSRGEFPGTDQQFQSLDADGDELISIDEANQYDRQTDEAESQ